MLSLREQLCAPKTGFAAVVRIPSRGIGVPVRHLSMAEHYRIGDCLKGEGKDGINAALRLIVADESGARFFADDEEPAEFFSLGDAMALIDAAVSLANGTKADHDAGKPSSTPTPTST